MNVIMGFTKIALQHADDPGKMKECLEKIRVSGSNLQELIDDVLWISRASRAGSSRSSRSR